MSFDIGFASQAPSLPTGGGVGGLGETFSPDLSTGTGTLSVPIDLPNGPNDSSPKLVLRYDSGTPNGPFGLGWSIPTPRLLRSTMVGRPRYDDTDTLVLEGSGPLVRGSDGVLRPQVDTGDWTLAASGTGFVATDRAGTRYHLGTSPASQITGLAGGAWAWLLDAVEDNLGLLTTYSWRAAGAQRYLDTIAWGPFEVRFGYEQRPDVLRWGRGGFLLVTDQRCTSIELHLPAQPASLVRRWTLGYSGAPINGASLLTSVRVSGFGADGSSLDAPPLGFGYTDAGEPTLLRVDPVDAGAAPPALGGGSRVELVDWTGTGAADILEIDPSGRARVWPNRAGSFGRPMDAGLLPELAGAASRFGLVDIDGDGIADIVRTDVPLARYQPRTATGFARPVALAQAPAVAPASAAVRIGDFDGDGRVDLLWSNRRALMLAHRDAEGSWLGVPDVVPGEPAGPPTDLSDPRVFCADMTGDGTPDVVRVDGSGVSYWPYLGAGLFGDRVVMADPPMLPYDCDPATVLVVDVDGDGCADVLHVAGGTLTWWPNRSGSGFEPPRVVRHLPTGAMAALRVADLAGRGTPSVCWTATLPSGRGRWFTVDLLGGRQAGLLSRIDNGTGRSTAISWSTTTLEAERDRAAGTPWPTRLPVVLPVVSGVTVTDAASGAVSATEYAYHEGRYDGVLREVCGFGRVTSRDLGDTWVDTLVTTHWFETGLLPDGSEPATQDDRVRFRAVRGRLLRQDRAADDGHLFDRFEQQWRVDDGAHPGTVTPRLVGSTRSVFEGQAQPVSRIVTQQTGWTPDGNVTSAVEQSFDAVSASPLEELHTDTEYAADPSGRFRQRISRVVQHDGTGAVVSDLRTDYDGLPNGQVGAQGLVTRRTALAIPDTLAAAVYGAELPDFAAAGYTRPAGADGWWVELAGYERTVDAAGVHGRITGANGGVNTVLMDPANCYPVEVVDPVGNRLTAEFDLRSYQATAMVDPSGARTEARFDALARHTVTIEPGDTDAEPTRALAYDTGSSPIVVTETTATTPGGPRRRQRQFFDGTGRMLQQRLADETGEIVADAKEYGARGLTVRSYLPYRATDPGYAAPASGVAFVELHYDALGRVVSTRQPDGRLATVTYLPGMLEERDAEQTRTDPGAPHAGALTRRYVSPAGKVERVDLVAGGRTLTTTDRHDIKGDIVEHVDALGASVRFDIDLLGRTLRISRPEVTQVVVLDASGDVVEARTGSSRVFRSYDLARRPTSVRHDTAGSAPVAGFVYHDAAGPAPTDAGTHTLGGRLVRIDDESGSTVFDYDERGRITTKTMTPAGNAAVTIGLAYRPDGLVDHVAYPGGQVTTYGYNLLGQLTSISGVIDAIDYDVAGRRTRVANHNGTVETNDHDPLTGWRTASTLTGPAGTLRQTGFVHDRVGNVTGLTSPDAALARSYGYDDLYRLVSASGAGSTLAYGYDDGFNLTSAASGAYHYGEHGAPAGCVTSVGADTYGYDDRGQIVSAPWGSNTFDAEGRLRVVTLADGGKDAFTYSAGGSLVRRVTSAPGLPDRVVLSPDPLIRVEDGRVVAQISDGDRIVARDDAGTLSWLHYDHLGSLVLVTDAAGAEQLRLAYDPYGQVLTRTGPAAASQGFATGQDIGHGLVLLGARWYSPRLGRFLSPDPLVGDPADPAAWNAYAYCRDNPTSYIDPSGRDFWKIFAAVVATIAIIAVAVIVTVCTFGIATPGTVALAVGGVSITWGAVFAATVVGIVAGGVIGGIAAARAGGDAGDIFLGVVVGGAVGGWAAFGGAFAGVAVGGALGLTSGTVLCGAVVGGVTGTINGAAMGFASGFAGGKNNGLKDVMLKVLVGAITGLALGAALGAISGMVAPKTPFNQAMQQASQPPSTPAAPSLTGPPAPVTSVGAAVEKTASELALHYAGAALPYAGAIVAPAAANAWVAAIVIDVGSAATSAFFDDLQQYLRTHNVNLGPFNFIKTDF
ncbi:MAG TPA: toxin TcdB middle/N-terminal domain-containing protein [Propionibacteriaceae bacterium]|nr:toxin TcdB middle/N-terminal domain-containing protein [Propionibacteriaceae bacterium]